MNSVQRKEAVRRLSLAGLKPMDTTRFADALCQLEEVWVRYADLDHHQSGMAAVLRDSKAFKALADA